jgi:hypothetical protein
MKRKRLLNLYFKEDFIMKKSTKSIFGIIAGVAIATASAIILGVSKKNANEAEDDCIEGEFEEVEDSDESTDEVED